MGNPWKDAQSVADLGTAMADWLGGRGRRWPGYCANNTEDETRHLLPTLIDCNRAGFVTTCSQPGEPPIRGYDGRMWRQRAAVDGWIMTGHLLNRIRNEASPVGVTIITNKPGQRTHPGVIVTEADGEPCTDFGWTPGHRKLIAHHFPGVGGKAIRELRTAIYLTLIDPVWGRDNVLWPALRRALR